MSMILGLSVFGVLQSNTITLQIGATSLPALIPRLAEVTGRKLEFAPELKDEVLLIAVKEVPVDELLERVATATSATWSKLKDGKLILTRPKGTEDEQRKAWLEERVTRLKAMVDQFRANALPKPQPLTDQDSELILRRMSSTPLQPPFADQAQFALMRSLHEKLPAGRLFARLMGSIDLHKVAEAKPWERVVFCSRPTKAQHPFSKGIAEAVGLLAEEQRRFAKTAGAMSSLPIVLPETGGASAEFFTSPVTETPAEVRLSVLDRGNEWRLELFSE